MSKSKSFWNLPSEVLFTRLGVVVLAFGALASALGSGSL